jgi:hypothetical protein
MAIKFLVSDDDDLIWDIDDHSQPVTEQQATLVALRRIAVSLGAIADALNNISNAQSRPAAAKSAKSAKPRKPKVAAKRKARR